ncbi:acetyl-CoA hydrolase/transferase family protein [Ponticaulis profundi]|uniref:Acetyl-CoA hydrolase/transferase family protein n=1 Tax=Ponticaulis profundi TaxID=2665222 RepID=A0ABW1S9S9_9PROT
MRPGKEVQIADLDWPSLISEGRQVVWSQGTAEPVTLTQNLMAARERIGSFSAFVGFSFGNSVSPDHTDRVSFQSYCGTANNSKLREQLDILPIHYSELSSELGQRKPVLLLSLAEGQDENSFSFGPAADFTADLINSAHLVIAEVSSKAPRTSGGNDVRRDQIDFIVRTDTPLLAPRAVSPTDDEAKIASLIAGMIEDGSTLQIGLGSLPIAIMHALRSHKDLGFHSGVFVQEVADLMDSGIINNARKRLDTGISTAGILSGDQSLLDWCHDRKDLQLRPVSYTHDVGVLSQIDRFVALNSAIEVDLTGQVNAELAAGRYLGAVGGAPAFMRGAAQSKGGLGIIALPSTAKTRSRIVNKLSGPVSTARSDVGFVVTENGIADLRGASLSERRDRLMAIAHPDFQSDLDAGLL